MIVKNNLDEIEQYITDEANNKGFCDSVYVAENTADVIETVKLALQTGVKLTVCGNHTSLTASSLPSSGWVLATDRLNKILEINPIEGFAIVEPGVTLHELQFALKPHNLYFPPDPTETSCFIGGMIGTNASGAHSFKYGSVRDFTLGLEVVLSTGEVLTLQNNVEAHGSDYTVFTDQLKEIKFKIPDNFKMPQVKNAAGYYLKHDMRLLDLFVGSEGTLGVITKAKVKVLPIPFDVISLVIFFDSLDNTFKVLDDIRKISKPGFQNDSTSGVQARMIEFFDHNSLILLAETVNGIPSSAVAALWVEQECESLEDFGNILTAWEQYFHANDIDPDNVWFGADESDKNKIIQMRHHLPVAVNSIIKQRGLKKIGTDIALPTAAFEAFYKKITGILKDKDIDYIAFGHFGDAHVHLNMLPRNAEEAERCQQLYYDFCAEAINKGGTFSAEHGVGKTKKNYFKLMFSDDDINLMRQIKLIFDPAGMLGVGNIF